MIIQARTYRGILAVFILLTIAQYSFSDEVECIRQLVPNRDDVGSRAAMTDVKLEGVALGGDLYLLGMDIPNPRYVKIDTQSGETAETVLARMAEAVVEKRPFNPYQEWPIRAEGNLLKSFPGFPGSYLFAGTEIGLGIPPPPTSLSVSYNAEREEVALYWEVSDKSYDAIMCSPGRILPGTATNAVWKAPAPRHRTGLTRKAEIDDDRRNKGLHRFRVVGCRGGVLSNAAVITWDYDDPSQQELDIQPFTGGICPNWKAWSHGSKPETLVLQQGTKGESKRLEQNPKRALNADDKYFYQLINTRTPDVVGGVCRKFLGLKPGNTYRLYTRMNTLDMDKVRQNWSFTFHAVPHAKNVTLSAEQMAAASTIPNGNTTVPVQQIASYGPGSTTKGKFEESSTKKSGSDEHAIDITMPPGAEVITVWFRYQGPADASGVGFDWIKLKDVTPKR